VSRKALLRRILAGSRNVSFEDFEYLIQGFGFRLARQRGSHFIFTREGIRELINIQPLRSEAKPYQIRQFLKIVEAYNLELEDES
jgi:predicted RNA binding protein YcfA (HicA-like mRNA interferase family)